MSTDLTAMRDLPANLAMMRMENETIQALAAAHPRDHEAIKREIVAQLEAYPRFAEAAIYSKPVGTAFAVVCDCGEEYETGCRWENRRPNPVQEPCPRCGEWKPARPPTKKVKMARGLSIRAAEALAEAYGFNRVRSEVTELAGGEAVQVEATFTDYQRGRIWQDAGPLSKFYRSRGGQMTRIPDDRFYGVIAKAEASRRLREVIIRSVPPGLRAELQAIAEEKARKELLDPDKLDRIVAKFSSRGVTQAQLEAFLGRTREAGWTQDDRLELLTVWTAIDDGESTVAEVFGDRSEPSTGAQPQASTVPGAGGGARLEDLEGSAGGDRSAEGAAGAAAPGASGGADGSAGAAAPAVGSGPVAKAKDDQQGGEGASAPAAVAGAAAGGGEAVKPKRGRGRPRKAAEGSKGSAPAAESTGSASTAGAAPGAPAAEPIKWTGQPAGKWYSQVIEKAATPGEVDKILTEAQGFVSADEFGKLERVAAERKASLAAAK